MARKNKRSMRNPPVQEPRPYEGEVLVRLLQLIKREIESSRTKNAALPEKFWFKQQFAIGVNEVTRVLERMAPVTDRESYTQHPSANDIHDKASSVKLQAILVADDCSPHWLTKHLPSLALSRKVPLICVKDDKAGSLRLGELVKLKTAIAVGVKVKGNSINKVMEEIIRGDILGVERELEAKSSEMSPKNLLPELGET